MHDAGETELARIWTKVEKNRAKQAAKPKGSALPQAWPIQQPADDLLAENARLRDIIREMIDCPDDAAEIARAALAKIAQEGQT